MKTGGVFIALYVLSFHLFSQSFQDITTSLTLLNYKVAPGTGSGVSAEDFDDDGDLDIAVGSHMDDAAVVLINKGDGTFEELVLNVGFHSRAQLWIDYNADHRMDLLLVGDCLNGDDTCPKTIALFEQQSDGTLVEKTEEAGLLDDFTDNSSVFGGATAADINEDGYIDVLIVHLSIESKLLMNNGNGTFAVVSDFFGQGRGRKNWTPVLFDLDGDGWLDYYQASDISTPNQYWSHDGDLTYTESAEALGINYAKEDMGITLGDYDNDLDLDIYISNIQDGEGADEIGNVLFRYDGSTYSDQSHEAGVFEGGWGWGISFMDGNNDGWLDIAATNGWDSYGPDSSRFWINNQDGTFSNMAGAVNFNDVLYASSLISFDFERDGDLDLVQTLKFENHSTGFRFYRNDLTHSGQQNYLVVQPRMNGTNHWAIGSLVKITTSAGQQIRPITAGISYFGQEPAEAFFGIGDVSMVDEVEVIWPGGGSSIVQNVSANQVVEVTDDDALHPPRNLTVDIVDASSFHLQWDAVSTTETSYVIERSTNSDFSEVVTLETSDATAEYTDSGLSPDSIYYYRVRSKKDSDLSRSTLHVTAQYLEQINSPSKFVAEAVSFTEARLTWEDRSNNEDGFTIQRSADNNFNSFIEFDAPSNAEQFINEGLEPMATYFYRIKAYSSRGESEFTAVAEVDLSMVLSVEENAEVIIYPNPTTGRFSIKDSMGQNFIGSIVSVDGNSVLDFSSDEPQIELQVPGTYFIKIQLGSGEILFRKLIVIKD